jgi:hypothetical protein
MQETTLEDRRHELKDLLEAMKAQPSRDWSEEKKRVIVLQRMLAAQPVPSGT